MFCSFLYFTLLLQTNFALFLVYKINLQKDNIQQVTQVSMRKRYKRGWDNEGYPEHLSKKEKQLIGEGFGQGKA